VEGVPITMHTGIVFVIRSLPVNFQPSGQSAQVLGCGLPSPQAQVGNEALVGPRMSSEPGAGLGTVVAGKVVGDDDTHTPTSGAFQQFIVFRIVKLYLPLRH
jgi:hypothetical protein